MNQFDFEFKPNVKKEYTTENYKTNFQFHNTDYKTQYTNYFLLKIVIFFFPENILTAHNPTPHPFIMNKMNTTKRKAILSIMFLCILKTSK